ncbi:hypothetical protein [Shinella zoogloeoides]|uniref:hypothetical protein n=1 Tax=Shinella zoogloeoides TaxID=352475 RepID=UPI0028A5FB22|nr:hypothetical protein [Shinella zoogloeoides]
MKDYIDASWVIVDRATGQPVLETFDFELCQFVNIQRFQVVPIMAWLQHLNHQR